MRRFVPSRRNSLVGFGLVTALGASALAVAQPAPVDSDVPAARMIEDREALREDHRAMRAERRAARIAGREAWFESRLASMRTRLGITDEQAPLWEALEESIRNNMLERNEARSEPRDPDASPPTPVERLEREQARLAARMDQLDATVAALTPLYDALDDEQKEIADRMLRRFEDGRFAMEDGHDRRGRFHGGRFDRRRGGPRQGLDDGEVFEQPL